MVRESVLPMKMILGKELLKDAELNIRGSDISIKPIEMKSTDDDENFLMCISTDIQTKYDDDIPNEVKELIANYKPKLCFETNIELKITATDEIPVFHKPRRLGFKEKEVVEQQVQQWIDDGVAIPYASEYASPVVLVRKKDGTTRVCIDYRSLNKKIVKDRYPVPLVEDLVDNLQKAKIFSTLDLKNGFFHVPVNKGSQKYLSFVTSGGQYTFLKTPFGCCNSPRVFQRYVNEIFRELIKKKIVLLYMDDIIVLAANKDEAIANLKKVFKCAEDGGLEIKWSKCQSMQKKVEFLGHVIENATVRP